MSHQEGTFQVRLQTVITFTLLLFIAMLVAACGGGSTPSTVGTAGSTTPPTTSTTTLKADAGSVCETLVTGVTYTKTPALSCNGGPNAYTAYLDGSKSTAANGQTLSYAWSFVSKPTGSTAVLTGANTAKPTFMPDKTGSYTVQLVVSAGGVSSARAVALVVALDNATINPSNPSATPYHFHGGLTNNCTVCHSGAFADLLTKPSTHIATSNNCQACHSPVGFTVTSFVDHAEVFGKCSDCHDGVTAIGKSPFHQQTTQECSDCHNTTKFVDLPLNADGITYDHSSVTEPCSACHNGKVAKGTDSDPKGHQNLNAGVECNACHNTQSFAQAFINHTDAKLVPPGSCGNSNCHVAGNTYNDANGNPVPIPSEATAPHPHINTGTSPACDLCHNITSFNMGGVYDHSSLGNLPGAGITVSCSTCHDGLNATGVPAPTATFTHPARTDCESCHNTVSFVPALSVDHTGFDPATKECTGSGCHNGTDATGMPTDSVHNATTNPNFNATTSITYCGQCHIPPGGSFHTATIDHSGFGALGSPLVDCTSCHDGSISTAQGKPSNHIVTTDNCGNCHSPQAPSFAGGAVDHSTIVSVNNGTTPPTATPTCVSCHDGSTATGQSLTHVPTTAASGTDCVVCHGTGYSSFTNSPFDHDAAGITVNCSSCHDGNMHDTTLVITKPTGHIPTTSDCGTCHQTKTNGPSINGTSSSGFTNADPFVNTVHPAYSTGCRTCHNGTYDNSIYKATAHPSNPNDPTTGSYVALHNTADTNGWDCSACHTTTHNFQDPNAVNHQDPQVQAQACISCHVDNQTVEPIGRDTSTHINLADTSCKDCHMPGGSFLAAFDHTTLDPGGSNYGKYTCTTCHDGVNATGKAQNHVATSRDCISCHAGHPPTVTSFANGTFDHTGPEMTGRKCMDCHDGTILGALGKSAKPDHVVTSADCSACHTTTAFKPATSFDHTGVTSGCAAAGCHAAGTTDVVDVTDDPNRTHIPILNGSTEVDCYNCHTNPGGTFANATMTHTVVTFEACEKCHDGNHDGANTAHIATTKSSTHFVTSIAACASCHKSTSAWTVGVSDYTHTGSGFPGTHSTKKVTSCSQCHTDTPANADISTFPLSPYQSTCAACHYKTGQSEHGNPLPSSKYNCGNSGCHKVSSSSF
jgi:hypothetical protein